MNTASCFDILCLSGDASLDDAKRSYRRLVKCWHPDQYGNDPEKQRIAHEKLKEINVAYRELVTLLKSKSASSEFPQEPVKTRRRRSGRVSVDPRSGDSFVKWMASFFRTAKNKPYRIKKSTAEVHSGPYRTTGKGEYDYTVGGDGPSDFSRVLRRAIRSQPGNTEGRQRFERRLGKSAGMRSDKPLRSAGIPRTSATPRHGRVDRVEKIRPIGRVGKIEE